jgi:hypothetical protein
MRLRRVMPSPVRRTVPTSEKVAVESSSGLVLMVAPRVTGSLSAHTPPKRRGAIGVAV